MAENDSVQPCAWDREHPGECPVCDELRHGLISPEDAKDIHDELEAVDQERLKPTLGDA
jgi:hypothetical protein